MRLWYPSLIKFLPTSQLSAQWRELGSIFKKQDNHILINYIYEYDKQTLYNYTQLVLQEMNKRDYNIKAWDNYRDYFSDNHYKITDSMFNEHNDEIADFKYLTICYFNLYEKFMRGQKDFSQDRWNKLDKFYKEQAKIFFTTHDKYDIMYLTSLL